MNAATERLSIAGPAGDIECAVDRPPGAAPIGVAVLCHPHPQFGGTMDNKVVHTLARAALACGWRSVRFNFRGIGASAGAWDGGRGEIDDAMAVIAAHRYEGERLLLGGFSFGGYIAAVAARRLAEGSDTNAAERLVLVGPSTERQSLPPVPADTIVVHGESDDVVPLSATFDWARPQALPVIVFPGAGHFFHGQIAALKALLVRQLHAAPAA